MSGSQGYVDDPPAAVDADSTNETNDSIIALLKAIKNLQIDLTELNVILAGAVSAGKVQCDTELTITGEGLATQATLADILAKIIAAPSTEAKQDLILTALGLIATEATTGDIKTAVEALAVATPDTADGDLADINAASASIDGKLPALVGGKIPVDASVSIDSVDIGDVDITEFPAGNLGQQAKAASLSVAPATDIIDPTYIGDVKFGEELPAGTQLIGKVGIDQSTPGTTNLVNVNGGASQSADIKVTLDSESVAVTGPLTNAELTAQALATEATLGTMQADIALMKADLAAILAILES